uniref:Uncharacterized protein n=1 Tax=Anguilla anguilla TaxID=7936 RepID=A0A0E9S758_ANGAN
MNCPNMVWFLKSFSQIHHSTDAIHSTLLLFLNQPRCTV